MTDRVERRPVSTKAAIWFYVGLAVLFGLAISAGFCARYTLFGGYLTHSQIKGLYVYEGDDVSEKVYLPGDGTFSQELKIGDEVYKSRGDIFLNTGANVVFRRYFYVRFSNDGKPLNPPRRDSVVQTHWDYSGKFKFILDNPKWDENKPGTGGPFSASDIYYLTRTK